jgi:dTDP-4-amino-4,6-dideoxygalactose transaminase
VRKWDEHVWHLFVVRTKERDQLQRYLQNKGIQTQIHYPIPPHKQKAYREWNTHQKLPITEKIHDEVLSLPVGGEVDKKNKLIVEIINEFN